jgi:antitoxin (DNA-binding transcriptional repressor) of toxin-antitoxin stability system
MATIHISETEAAKDFPSLMDRVREGSEVVIESGSQPVALLRSAGLPRRSISESIAMAKESSLRLGYKPVIDDNFAADMDTILSNRKPSDRSAWTR